MFKANNNYGEVTYSDEDITYSDEEAHFRNPEYDDQYNPEGSPQGSPRDRVENFNKCQDYIRDLDYLYDFHNLM